MDFTGAQFGGHLAFTEVSVIPEADPWACSPYDYDNLLPSALSSTDRGITNHAPSDSRFLYAFEPQYPGLFSGSHFAAGEQVAHSGFGDTAIVNLDIYPLAPNLTFTDADFYNLSQPFEYPTHLPHYLTNTSQGPQQLPPALDSPPSFLVGCGSLGGITPAFQDDANQYGMLPTPMCHLENAAPLDNVAPLDNTAPPDNTAPLDNIVPLKDTVPLDNIVPLKVTTPLESVTPPKVDYTSSPELVWLFMDKRGKDRYACTWEGDRGKVCTREFSFDNIKRHIRQVHFRIL